MSSMTPARGSMSADAGAGAGPARLRGHHLICLRTFAGQGYDERFVGNLREVLARATREGVTVIEGADDVCAACPTLGPDGRCEHEPGAEEEIRALDSLALEVLGLEAGAAVTFGRPAPSPEMDARWLAEACEGCEWEPLCGEARASRA